MLDRTNVIAWKKTYMQICRIANFVKITHYLPEAAIGVMDRWFVALLLLFDQLLKGC